MLIAALATMLTAVCLGMWLSAIILIREEAPKKIPVTAMLHATVGATAVVLRFLALQGPKRGEHTGAGGFGWTAFAMMALALALGITILSYHLRRRGAPTLLIAFHAMLGISGGVMLSAWWASPVSFGH
jgi:hypothetical protein